MTSGGIWRRLAGADGWSRFVGEFRMSPIRTALALGTGRRVLVGRRFRVVGASRIRGRLFAGTMHFRFVDIRRGGLIRVEGELVCSGHVDVGHGNEWYVAPGARVEIGDGTYFSPSGRLLARNRISIGESCAIGWETQILDDNQHPLSIDGQEHPPEGTVTIGRHVWIGSRVSILKDTVIGDDCVIAAGAVVKGDFSEPGCLIGGTPARVIRRGVSWRVDRTPGEEPVVLAR
ncbi:acyltransferase [Amnibacterium kyonggiense]